MNNYENYGKINKDYTINNQNDDAFESTIKEERKRQKNIFAGNDINYSKNMRYQQEQIKPSQDTMKVQKTLNEYGYTDQQGKKLKVDGAYGPKTDYAFNNAYNANKSIFENREKQRKRDEIMPLVTSAYDNMFADASTRKFASNKDEIVNTKKFLNQFGYTDMLDRKLEENDTWDTNSKIAFEKYAWDGIPRQEVLDLQKSLNKNGIADKDGNPLLEDGKYSKKFYDAVNNAFKTLDGKFDTAIKRGDTPKLTKGEIINLAADAYGRLLKEYGPEKVKGIKEKDSTKPDKISASSFDPAKIVKLPYKPEKPNGSLLEIWGKGEEKKGITPAKPVPLPYRPNKPEEMTEEEKRARLAEALRKHHPKYKIPEETQPTPDASDKPENSPENITLVDILKGKGNSLSVNSGIDNIVYLDNNLNLIDNKEKDNKEVQNLSLERTLYDDRFNQKSNKPFEQPFEMINSEIQKIKDDYNALDITGQENVSQNLESMGYKTKESNVLSAINTYARKNNIDNATAIKRLSKLNNSADTKSVYVGVRGIAETYGDISWDDSTNTANVALYDGSKFNFKQKDGKGTFIGSDGKMYVSALPNSNGVGYNLPSLSGDPNVDLLLYKALGERGYKEGDYNKNKYGDWYNSPNNPWCAQFVSWAAASVGIMDSVVGRFQHCAEGQRFYKSNDSFHYVANGDKPKAGDTFFMTTSGYPNGTGHTGLILAYTIEDGEEIVYTIEGNAEDAVSVARRKLSDLYGFGSNGGTTNGIVPKNFDINRGGSTL